MTRGRHIGQELADRNMTGSRNIGQELTGRNMTEDRDINKKLKRITGIQRQVQYNYNKEVYE